MASAAGLRRTVFALAALLAATLLSACTAPASQMNEPLRMGTNGKPNFLANYGLGRYFSNLKQNVSNSADAANSDILLFVTISGGGKRSAAFGHGALRGLRDIALHPPDGRAITLLNALDYISGVSGGSFPAAHYGLYRDRSFETFPSDFLYVDVNAYMWGIYTLPWNWAWMVDPLVGTNDYMAQVYDRLMFHGATFADLARVGQPIVSINATDIVNGTTFPFIGLSFGLLCSDLNSFPIARAMAASNGFPGLFGPVTLKSYAERCGGERPPLATAPMVSPPETEGTAARRRELARVEARVAHLADRIRAIRCATAPVIHGHPCGDVRGNLVHLALSDIADQAVRERLARIPTGLTIPREDVDALMSYGEALVRENPVIRAVADEADFVPLAPPSTPRVASR